MINIDLNQIMIDKKSILDIMADQYAKVIDDFLDEKCKKIVKNKNSPLYIYYILKELEGIPEEDMPNPPNLICLSLKNMDTIIQEIQKVPGWSWLGVRNTDEETCKPGVKYNYKSCIILKEIARIIHGIILKKFSDIYNAWGERPKGFRPYDFIKSLKMKACPYCNLEYFQIATFKKDNVPDGEDKYVRPDLDHFYPKSEYPFFAVSLYNLVPSCKTCNSSIKHDNSFYSYKEIIHPYDEEKINYCDCIKYILLYLTDGAIKKLFEEYADEELKKFFKENNEKEIQEYLKKNAEIPIVEFLEEYGKRLIAEGFELNKPLEDDAIEISIKCIPGSIKKSSKENITEDEISKYLRAMKMFNYFAIGPRLEQGHNDYIREIAIKAIEYPKSYIEYLNSKGYLGSKALRIFFGNYIDPKFFNQRPLSKITHDVIEQLRPEILKELDEENT